MLERSSYSRSFATGSMAWSGPLVCTVVASAAFGDRKGEAGRKIAQSHDVLWMHAWVLLCAWQQELQAPI